MITQKIIARTDSLKLDKIISRYGEDSMRQVVFVIVRPDPDSEELIPITIPEDAVGSFRILKPSGNFVIVPMSKSVLSTGETAFDVVLPASANTAKGSGYYDIRITSDRDKYYFTAQGEFIIDDNIISDEVLEDVSEVNGLIFPDDFLTVEDNVAYLDDDTISRDSTWSSNKISNEIEAHAGGDVSKTVSGNPVTFEDGADAPLVKCVTTITGYQSGTGTPSPDNIRPITAYTEGKIEVMGKNLFDETYTGISSNVTYQPINVGSVEVTLKTTCPREDNIGCCLFLLTGSVSSGANNNTNGVYAGNPRTVTATSGYITIAYRYQTTVDPRNYDTFLFDTSEIKNSITTYPSAIYRGSEDVVNGEVVTDWGMIASYAGETLPGEWISDRDEYAPGTTPTTGAQVAYELATPTTSSVTPTNLPIKSLNGYTHIESSTGDMEVEYITERFQPLIDSIKQL